MSDTPKLKKCYRRDGDAQTWSSASFSSASDQLIIKNLREKLAELEAANDSLVEKVVRLEATKKLQRKQVADLKNYNHRLIEQKHRSFYAHLKKDEEIDFLKNEVLSLKIELGVAREAFKLSSSTAQMMMTETLQKGEKTIARSRQRLDGGVDQAMDFKLTSRNDWQQLVLEFVQDKIVPDLRDEFMLQINDSTQSVKENLENYAEALVNDVEKDVYNYKIELDEVRDEVKCARDDLTTLIYDEIDETKQRVEGVNTIATDAHELATTATDSLPNAGRSPDLGPGQQRLDMFLVQKNIRSGRGRRYRPI